MSAVPPITLDQITPEWVAERRAIIERDGHATRAGKGARIEIKSLTTNQWYWLVLPGGASAFTTETARDAVLEQLTGK